MNSKISQKRYSLVRNSIIGVLVLFCSTLGLIYYYSRIPEIQVEGYVTYKDSNKDDFYIISIKTRNISIYDKRVKQYQPSRNIERSPNQSLGLAYDEEIFRHYIVHPDNRRVYFKYWCLSLNEMDWSPNSNYIVYRGDDDNGKWIAKIFIMNTKTGKTDFLTTGDVPRWMIPKERFKNNVNKYPSSRTLNVYQSSPRYAICL